MMSESNQAPLLPQFADIPVFDAFALAKTQPADLLALLIEHEDRVPRVLFDACVARGDAMVACLDDLYARIDDILDEGAMGGEWWALLHGIRILGELSSAAASDLLVRALHAIEISDDEGLVDSLAGQWPCFFTNKSAAAIAGVRQMMGDTKLEWGTRANAASVVVAAAAAVDVDHLEGALDEVAALADDHRQDLGFRMFLGAQLLDFPRSRHRDLLLALAAKQNDKVGRFFSAGDVREVLAKGVDDPEWQRLPHPLSFYEEEAILARQMSWADDAADLLSADDLDAFDRLPVEPPYVREAPKIGRNDPCPCGSGRKHKKCCL